LLCVLGCGGGADRGTFTVAPEAPAVAVGDQLALAARPGVDLASDMEWEVQEPYGGGLRNSQGDHTVYFAPPAAGTYHLVLHGVKPDGRRLRQVVEVRVLALPSLEPAQAQVPQGGAVTFTATMKGLPRNTVTWQVEEAGGGEITPEGRYTAPAKAGTYHVAAVSTLDPTVSARATVVVD
jgi:hypothetical protein